jgi:prepilin-type N-terminal cleavage/methylation domain-containing protein
MDKNKGFTLIELIVVIGIVSLFTGISIAKYNENASQLKLRNEAKKLVDVLELAKKKALTGDLLDKNCADFRGYRVIIGSGNYSLNFNCGGTYTEVQNYNLTTNNSIIGGTGNYDFTPLMINPIFPATAISVKNSSINKSIKVNISSIGIIDIDETLL